MTGGPGEHEGALAALSMNVDLAERGRACRVVQRALAEGRLLGVLGGIERTLTSSVVDGHVGREEPAEIDGQEKTFFPANIARLAKAKPIYETLPGWDEDISAATTFDELPANAREYVERVEEIIGTPIEMVGVGPKRSQTIVRT